MTHEDRGHYADKHQTGTRASETLAEKIRHRCTGGELPCPVAFEIAEIEGVPPSEVGTAADLLEIPIVKCAMGLFGHGPVKKTVKPAPEVSAELKSTITDSMVAGRLPCAAAWAIAGRLGIQKLDVSAACETLGVKIKPCQLGAF